MKKQVGIALSLLVAVGLVLLSTIERGSAESVEGHRIPNASIADPSSLSHQTDRPLLAQAIAAPPLDDPFDLLSTDCKLRPGKPRRPTRQELAPIRIQLPLARFRSDAHQPDPNAPSETIILAHPTNFGWRYLEDLNGQSAQPDPIVVLHETDASAESTLNLFQTPHANDDDQVSYHALIESDGTIVHLVPPDRRAFGAGDSSFVTMDHQEKAVKTNPNYDPSVNNFAYHISLVTPPDGRGSGRLTHSGYTQAQYRSLAWLVAKTGIPDDRITTHRLVDRSGQRVDPRSFDVPTFLKALSAYDRAPEILLPCTVPSSLARPQETQPL